VLKNQLLLDNRGASIEVDPNKIAILIDATGSMNICLKKTKNTVHETFQRITSILKENDIDLQIFQVQIIAYRNYNAPASQLIQSSGWCNDAKKIHKFLEKVDPCYGWGNEAIEVALQFLNQDLKDVKQVVIIGDAGPNEQNEVFTKREQSNPESSQVKGKSKHTGEKYWMDTKFKKKITYYEKELQKLIDEEIKINAFYLNEAAKRSFEKMANATGYL